MADTAEERIVADLVVRLRQRRESLGLSINKVAQAANLDHRAIGRIEAGERSPSLFTLLKMARALKVRLSSLLREVD